MGGKYKHAGMRWRNKVDKQTNLQNYKTQNSGTGPLGTELNVVRPIVIS